MRAARDHGIPLSEFDGWADDDRAWAIALHTAEQELAAKACPSCGDTTGACQDPAYQRAWDVDVQVCYRTKTSLEYMQAKHKDDPLARRLILRTKPSSDPSRIKRIVDKLRRPRG